MKENNNQNQNQNDNQSRQILLSVLAVAILVVAVVGVSFAAFTYSKSGDQTNTITTGTITMEYTEDGPFIAIDNAMPVSDSVGKTITNTAGAAETGSDLAGGAGHLAAGAGGVFDFTVKATISGTTTINYQIGAEKAAIDSKTATESEVGVKELPDNAVKIYLEKDDSSSGEYSAVDTTVSGDVVKTYDDLTPGSGSGSGTVPATQKVLGSGSFSGTGGTHKYRLRMWVAENYDINKLNDDKTVPGKILTYKGQFKLKVNVYGKAA